MFTNNNSKTDQLSIFLFLFFVKNSKIESKINFIFRFLIDHYKKMNFIFTHVKNNIKIGNNLHFSSSVLVSQNRLREFLIKNKNHECIICDKRLPLCLLEAAHLKPLSILSKREENNYNIVEFMCRYCHTLYDRGLIGVNNSVLEKSDKLNLTNYDLVIEEKKIIKAFNDINFEFFDYHYSKIYNK
jgi:hypothetical protein